MKGLVIALLTTYALGHRFVVEFEEANKSEGEQAMNALHESEKQLGAKMDTPLFTQKAKRIEAQHEVDYMESREFKKFEQEEKEEEDETAASIAEAKKEISDRELAEKKRQTNQAALESKQRQQMKQQLAEKKRETEWKKAQEEVQMENASFLQINHSK